MILLALAAGCPPRQSPGPTTPLDQSRRPIMPADARKNAADPAAGPRYRTVVLLHVIRIELPVGSVSGTERLWSYLDEERIAVSRSAGLGRNGLRMGLGDKQSWPDVVRILTKLTGKELSRTTKISLPGTVLDVVIKPDQPIATIFTFYADRTVSGSDYPAGDCVLAVACTVDQSDPRGVLMTGLPQIRSAKQRREFVRQAGKMSVVTKRRRAGFEPLTFRAPIDPEGFLIVGPGAAARRPSSIGRHFLISETDGLRFETVLVLIPELVRKLVKIVTPAQAADMIRR